MTAGELVLVVDDEPAIVRALSAALRRGATGSRVTATGAEALAGAATRDPAVVILDLGLPDIDGVEVCRLLRRWNDTPIIVLTAEAAESRKVAALDGGADGYVTKPFSTPELLARVRVALRHRRDTGAPGATATLRVGEVEIGHRPPPGNRPRCGGRPHAEGVRLPRRAGPPSRPGAHPPHAPAGGLGGPATARRPSTCACTPATCTGSSGTTRPARAW